MKIRRLQFSLRLLLLLGVGVAIAMAHVRARMRRCEAIEDVFAGGGVVLATPHIDKEPPGPACLRRLLGEEFFLDNVLLVALPSNASDRDLAQLTHIGSIKCLTLRGDAITQHGLEHLRALERLDCLYLSEMHISDSKLRVIGQLQRLAELHLSGAVISELQVESLRTMLPNTRIALVDSVTAGAAPCMSRDLVE